MRTAVQVLCSRSLSAVETTRVLWKLNFKCEILKNQKNQKTIKDLAKAKLQIQDDKGTKRETCEKMRILKKCRA